MRKKISFQQYLTLFNTRPVFKLINVCEKAISRCESPVHGWLAIEKCVKNVQAMRFFSRKIFNKRKLLCMRARFCLMFEKTFSFNRFSVKGNYEKTVIKFSCSKMWVAMYSSFSIFPKEKNSYS